MSSDRGELEPRQGDDRAFRGGERPGPSAERHPCRSGRCGHPP